jgi:hypothetical protein
VRKPARLKVQLNSKHPGLPKHTAHRIGTRCLAERNPSNPGQWILYFGKEYALIDAVRLHETVEIEECQK